MMIIGFDPGRDKCGLAVMNQHKEILFRSVVNSSRAIALIQDLIAKYSPKLLVMGNQTTSKQWKAELKDNINLSIVLVDEKNSSVEARERYWLFNPPQGLGRLIPLGLRVPPEPIDDIVAVILIERYWHQQQ
ncbi:Resolvase RNase H domain protein fold protein [Cyanobacterium stanieri PCC 7202]|uniref:Resolvase RNase H domain protein fold protein n=1 Tax=Cyanobacterium stanieri (strain ATCC 29140 / PCC 7202) TaxID=292563 RepID=K9YK11_CYASC|nr:Resolvase RNase H domain protein fold protein [Cyanobacterium stanieri PCC 7202]